MKRQALICLAVVAYLLLHSIAFASHVERSSSGSSLVNPGSVPIISYVNVDCNQTTGCNDPNGIIAIDPWSSLTMQPGGRQDADGSMWSSATPNAVSDWINDGSTHTFGSNPAQWARSFSAASDSDDTFYCRYNGAGTPADLTECTVDDGNGNLCQDSIGGSGDSEVIVISENNRYYPWNIQTYSGCNSGTNTVTGGAGLPADFSASATYRYMWPDGVHPSTYGSRWLAQTILEASWEEFFIPRQNLMVNGKMTTDCATAGWTASSGTLAQTSFDPTIGGSSKTAYGSGCKVTGYTAGATFTSDAMTVKPNTYYTFRGWLHLNSVTATHTITITVRDVTNGADLTSATTVWMPNGDADKNPWTSNTSQDSELFNTRMFFGKVLIPPTCLSASIKFTANVATAEVDFDEILFYKSIHQNANFNYIFPDSHQNWFIEGDSRSQLTSVDGSDIPAALDTMMPLDRPKMSIIGTFGTRTNGISGKSLADDVCPVGTCTLNEYMSPILQKTPQFGLIYFGVNDAITGGHDATFGDQTAAQYETNMLTARETLRDIGTIPVLLMEMPYRGDTAETLCNTGSGDNTANCSTAINEYNRTLIHNNDLF